jgi:hypothetical protein
LGNFADVLASKQLDLLRELMAVECGQRSNKPK